MLRYPAAGQKLFFNLVMLLKRWPQFSDRSTTFHVLINQIYHVWLGQTKLDRWCCLTVAAVWITYSGIFCFKCQQLYCCDMSFYSFQSSKSTTLLGLRLNWLWLGAAMLRFKARMNVANWHIIVNRWHRLCWQVTQVKNYTIMTKKHSKQASLTATISGRIQEDFQGAEYHTAMTMAQVNLPQNWLC